MIKTELENILKDIPLEIWDKIVTKEPEYEHFKELRDFYSFGAFETIMLMSGLNAYQLKGKAQEKYFPVLKEYLKKNENKSDFDSLRDTFLSFYQKERAYNAKIKRVNKFFNSELAKIIWKRNRVIFFKENFQRIWLSLAATMDARKEQKTIVFAMKCLGIGLIMEGCSDFDFSDIPIPIDSRVKYFITRLGFNLKDTEIREFFNDVVKSLKHINMIHLDSLIWQIGRLSKEEIYNYFKELGIEDIAHKLNNIMNV